MSVTQNDTRIEKLTRQVRRFEEKGLFDTAAHEVLANLLKAQKQPVEGVTPRNVGRGAQETEHGK